MPVATPPPDLIGSRDRAHQDALLKSMRQHFAQAEEAEAAYRRAAVRDLEFLGGQHWDEADEQSRRAMGRPCLTMNTLPQYERQITNESRTQYPSIKVLPVGDGADKDTAKILQGITRHIEQASHAEVAYHTALEAAVRHGRGYFRLCLDYLDPLSFEQTILIARIRNPFMVYHDPSCQLPTYADSRWAFCYEHVDKVAFQDEWQVSTSAMELWRGPGDTWIRAHEVRVAEYFWRDVQRGTLGELTDGTTGLLEPTLLSPMRELENPEPLQKFVAHLLTPRPRYVDLLTWYREQAPTVDGWLADCPQTFTAIYRSMLFDLVRNLQRVRPTHLTTIRWVKTNGHVILEESIWPGQWIPIIPVLGNELDINNKVMYSGIVRHAIDPMKLEDYWVTMQAEHVALSPVAPWIIAEGQLEGYEQLWATANKIPRAFLPYKLVFGANGQPAPPPQRNSFEAPLQGILASLQTSQGYTQQAIGMYRGNLGAPSQEESGVAILRKDQQSDQGAMHYGDNLGRAVECCGEQVTDLIPKVLTPGTIQRMIGDDGSAQMVQLIASKRGVEKPPQLAPGIVGVYDLDMGRYDVNTTVGPSYATRREQAADQLINISKAIPDVMKAAVDIIVGSLDVPYAEEIAARLKKTVPAELLDEPGNEPEQQLVQAQAQLKDVGMAAQQMHQQLQQLGPQMEALARENQTLKMRLDAKYADLQLNQRELAQQVANDAAKIVLEEQKLAWEREQFYVGRQPTGDVQAKLQELETMLTSLQDVMQAVRPEDARPEPVGPATQSGPEPPPPGEPPPLAAVGAPDEEPYGETAP